MTYKDKYQQQFPHKKKFLEKVCDYIPEIFSKKAGVCVWVIPTNDNESIQIKLQGCFFSLFKL